MEEGSASDVEPWQVQARSVRKVIKQGVFENKRSTKRQHVGHVCGCGRTENSMRETIKSSPQMYKTTENHCLGYHFAAEIHPKSLPKRSGAPLGRSGVSWSTPRTLSGRFWPVPKHSQDALGRSWDAPGTPLGRSKAFFGRLRALLGAHFSRICSYIRANAVSGLNVRRFCAIFAIAARIDCMLFSVCFC